MHLFLNYQKQSNSVNLVNLINLLNVPKIGQQRVRLLMSQLGENANPFELSIKEICSVKGLDKQSAESIIRYSDFEYGIKEYESSLKKGINLVSFWDDNFPMLLKKIYNPPLILYCKGQPLIHREDAVAIVGTRLFTPYGKIVTQKLALELNQSNISIVSGLARGIDTIAHRETVNFGGRTIAVLGSGLDVIYPNDNIKLANDICEKGTLISEFPLGTKPNRGNFPMRNRIISGLCHATVVIEAGNRSGAILTALNAVDQNRDIFAVPGRITDKQSIGSNRLIRNGAIPLFDGEQIIREINPRLFNPVKSVQKAITIELTDKERAILENLGHDPVHIDELANSVDMNITSLLQILLTLEMKNAIQQIGGKQFVRA
ncbi:MAG: DNA-protecting protein DprA [Candidatus Marinimicrobia bacterium]|nr:DNA-protecting protein DprA [Candidatus Neomarinimicrobiota bacterium]MBT5749452.1 DNA-protecting protein DprA [Candidatus Neomarinimicrobiota bacterium]MBT7042061.1 DNA-protecting protein DprA [Candidatus Neomarinimicrobiota bacterium]MBT7515209.1 DNA-protecting protein DprA [Candidatus Neomarinimicrobiota bacterium]